MTTGLRRAASLATLRQRATMLAAMREFFAGRGVLEVETPALSRAAVTDPAIASMNTHIRGLGPVAEHYLHTSPEYAMKRLLAAGSGDIYQLCRVFRDDELGRWHQPEFTLLEWYRVDWDDRQLATEVAELVTCVLAALGQPPRTTVHVSYADAFRAAVAVDADATAAVIADRLATSGIEVPAGLAHAGIVDLAFATLVVPTFDAAALTLLCDYPANQAALARIKLGPRPVAARFEVFSGGIELANGFHELADATEQRRRFEREQALRRDSGLPTGPIDEDLLAALATGLPDCAGVALGVDRLMALAIGAEEVAATMSFAHSRLP